MRDNDIEQSMSFPLNNKIGSIVSVTQSQSEFIPVFPESRDFNTSFSYQNLPTSQNKNIGKYKAKQNLSNRNGAFSQQRCSP